VHHEGSGIVGLLVIAFFAAIALSLFVFWIWMLIDAIKNRWLTSTERIVWVLVIVFLHWLGAVVYFFAGRQKWRGA